MNRAKLLAAIHAADSAGYRHYAEALRKLYAKQFPALGKQPQPLQGPTLLCNRARN